MKAYLLHPDADFDFGAELCWNADTLREDLGLDTVTAAMSGGDEYLESVARNVLLTPLHDTETVRFRQDVLDDCLAQPELTRQLYDLAVGSGMVPLLRDGLARALAGDTSLGEILRVAG